MAKTILIPQFTKAILATAVLAGFATQALADDAALLKEYSSLCSKLPPQDARQEPIDPYVIARFPSNKIQHLCGLGVAAHTITGCAFQAPKPHNPSRWIIAIDAGISGRDYACVLMYEKAHLPPNNWVDDRWEHYLEGKD